MCIGGPALIYYVTPTEEELFLRYNPELQRRSLERRQEKQEDFEQFVGRLKEYSKSEKPGKSFGLPSLSTFLPQIRRVCCYCICVLHGDVRINPHMNGQLTVHAVWTAWEEDVSRRRQLGVQAELDRRRIEAQEAEARKQEMRNSLR